MAGETEPQRLGIRIEKPQEEKVGFFFLLLSFLTLLISSGTLIILVCELLGMPLPAVLKVPMA